jgi:ketosteroid isomerase-like protein
VHGDAPREGPATIVRHYLELGAAGDGVLADGTRYTPEYAIVFEVVDGRIASIREYIDTEYVAATFRLPATAS